MAEVGAVGESQAVGCGVKPERARGRFDELDDAVMFGKMRRHGGGRWAG